MTEYLIVDAHLHTYQTRDIGLQAMQRTSQTDYGGTIDELLDVIKKVGVSKAVMVNMLPVADMRDAAVAKLPEGLSPEKRHEAQKEIDQKIIDRLKRRNQWTCDVAKENPNLVAFIGIDPILDPQSVRQEVVDKVENHGARGIKLHPSSNRHYPNDRRLWPAYETAQELGLPVLSHSGKFESAVTSEQFAQPKYFEEVASSFPKLKLVLAHLGANYWDQSISLARAYPNVYFDCSAAITPHPEEEERLSNADLVSLIREIGIERVMFGSDFPWYAPTAGIQRLQRLDLTEEEKRLILGENAVRILKL